MAERPQHHHRNARYLYEQVAWLTRSVYGSADSASRVWSTMVFSTLYGNQASTFFPACDMPALSFHARQHEVGTEEAYTCGSDVSYQSQGLHRKRRTFLLSKHVLCAVFTTLSLKILKIKNKNKNK